MENYIEFVKFILPDFFIDHFNLVKQGEVMRLYFEELNNPPTTKSTIDQQQKKQDSFQRVSSNLSSIYFNPKVKKHL